MRVAVIPAGQKGMIKKNDLHARISPNSCTIVLSLFATSRTSDAVVRSMSPVPPVIRTPFVMRNSEASEGYGQEHCRRTFVPGKACGSTPQEEIATDNFRARQSTPSEGSSCGKRRQVQMGKQGRADIGKGLPASDRAGGEAVAEGENRNLFARVIEAVPSRIAAMIGCNHDEVSPIPSARTVRGAAGRTLRAPPRNRPRRGDVRQSR
jgi:hypothetical protein